MNHDTKHNIPALRRAVNILDHVQESAERLSAADIVKGVNIPKSTGHGLIHVLCELEMLQRHNDGTFSLGTRLSKWGSGFLSNIDLLEAFNSISDEREDLMAYTLTLSVPEKNEVVYIACRNSSSPLGFTFRIGMRLPIIFTATGKAIMSTWTDEEIDHIKRDYTWPKPMTEHSTMSYSKLLQEVEQTRKNGFSIDDCQIRDGMVCLGAPIYNYSRKAVAGIAVSMMEHEASGERIMHIGSEVKKTAMQLSRLLGYHEKAN